MGFQLTTPHLFVPKDTIPTRYFASLKSLVLWERSGPPESPEQESSPKKIDVTTSLKEI